MHKITRDLKIKTSNTGKIWGNSILIPYTGGNGSFLESRKRTHTSKALHFFFCAYLQFPKFYSKYYFIIRENTVISKLSVKTQLIFYFLKNLPNTVFVLSSCICSASIYWACVCLLFISSWQFWKLCIILSTTFF